MYCDMTQGPNYAEKNNSLRIQDANGSNGPLDGELFAAA